MTHQTELFNVISKPIGINRNALVTSPNYDFAIGLQNGHFSQLAVFHPQRQTGGRQTGDKYISINKLYTSR